MYASVHVSRRAYARMLLPLSNAHSKTLLYLLLLQEINLKGCDSVTDSGLATLVATCPNLYPDSITSDRKGDLFCEAVAKYRYADIKAINLDGCPDVSDIGIQYLVEGCPNLLPDNITAVDSKKGDKFLQAIGSCYETIDNIDLSNCENVSDEGLVYLMKGCPNLHPDSVKVKHNVKGPLFVNAVARHRPELTEIDLRNTVLVTDAAVGRLIESCAHLSPHKILLEPGIAGNHFTYAVARCHPELTGELFLKDTVSDFKLAFLVRCCPGLHPSDIHCRGKGDRFLEACAKHRRDLGSKGEKLDFTQCPNVTDWGLACLVESCPQLAPNKILSNAKGIEFIAQVSVFRPELLDIDLQACPEVTDTALASLVRGCRKLAPERILSSAKGDLFLEAVAEVHPNITSIDLLTCHRVTDQGLAKLVAGCAKLKPDKCNSEAKGDDFVKAIAEHHRHLTTINLQNCAAVTDGALALLLQSCPNLHPDKILSPNKANAFVKAVVQHRPNIKAIDLGNCPSIADETLAMLVTGCQSLHPDKIVSIWKGDFFLDAVATYRTDIKRIDVSGCFDVSDVALARLLDSCPKLEFSEIISFKRGDQFCATVAEKYPTLKEIDLSDSDVTDVGVRGLAEKCKQLQSINLCDCQKVGAPGANALAQKCPALTSVNLTNTLVHEEAVVVSLLENCPKLHPDKILCDFNKTDVFAVAVSKAWPTLVEINLLTRDRRQLEFACERPTGEKGLGESFIKAKHVLTIPDAAGMTISCTAYIPPNSSGYIRFLKGDGTVNNAFWGKERYTSDATPGNGVAPALEIPDNTCTIEWAYTETEEIETETSYRWKCTAKEWPLVTEAGLAVLAARCKKLRPEKVNSTLDAPAVWNAVLKSVKLDGTASVLELRDEAAFEQVPDAMLAEIIDACNLAPDSVPSHHKGDAFCVAVARAYPGLVTLNLRDCVALTDTGVQQLSIGCPSLVYVDLIGCRLVTDVALCNLISGCSELHPDDVLSYAKGPKFIEAVVKYRPEIKKIDLENCASVSDEALAMLLTGCQSLHPDDIVSVRKGDVFLDAVVVRCADITQIDLSGCVDISDVELTRLVEGCPQLDLTTIDLANRADQFCAAMAKKRPNMKSFDLSGSDVTDVGVRGLAEKCKQLQSINLCHCEGVRGPGVTALAQNCPNLTSVDVTDTSLTELAVVYDLVEKCPKLHPDKILCNFSKTDMFAVAVSKARPQLKEIDFFGVTKLVRQSEHPPNMDSTYLEDTYSQVRFPEHAQMMTISFDQNTKLVSKHQPSSGYVRILKGDGTDKTAFWGEEKYVCTALPGMGKTPALEIPANTCTVHVNMVRTSVPESWKAWGWKFTAMSMSSSEVTEAGLAVLAARCKQLRPDSVRCTANAPAAWEAVTFQSTDGTDSPALDLRDRRVYDSMLAKVVDACDISPDRILSRKKGNEFCKSVSQRHPDLKQLNLYDCDDLGDEGVQFIADSCSALTNIDLMNCRLVTLDSLSALLEHCPQLHPDGVRSRLKGRGPAFLDLVTKYRPDIMTIDLRNMVGIAFNAIENLMEKCVKIVEIQLEGCSQLSQEQLDVIKTKLGEHRLNLLADLLSGSPDLHPNDIDPLLKTRGDIFIQAVAAHRPGIEDIDLGNMVDITFDDIQIFINACTKLLKINLEGCSQFSQQQLDIISDELDDHRQQMLETMLSESPELHPDAVSLRLKGKGDRYLDAVATYRPEIEHIDIHGMVGITLPICKSFIRKSKRLLETDVDECPNLSAEDTQTIKELLDDNRQNNLCEMLAENPDLHPDDVEPRFKGKGDRYLEAVVKYRPDIEHIDVHGMDGITLSVSHKFIKKSKSLLKMGLDERANLSDTGVEQIGDELDDNRQNNLSAEDTQTIKDLLDDNRQNNLCKALSESPELHPDNVEPRLKGKGDRYLDAVATHRPDIVSIDLTNMRATQNVRGFVEKSKNLLEINLEGTQLSNDDKQEINAKLEINRKSSLTKFLSKFPDTHPDNVESRLKASGAGYLEAVVKCRPDIKTIDLTNMVDITFEEIENLLQSCEELREIKLEGCSQLSLQQLDDIGTQLQSRQVVDTAIENADAYQADSADPAENADGYQAEQYADPAAENADGYQTDSADPTTENADENA